MIPPYPPPPPPPPDYLLHDTCRLCGQTYSEGWWHRLVKGHWPDYIGYHLVDGEWKWYDLEGVPNG